MLYFESASELCQQCDFSASPKSSVTVSRGQERPHIQWGSSCFFYNHHQLFNSSFGCNPEVDLKSPEMRCPKPYYTAWGVVKFLLVQGPFRLYYQPEPLPQLGKCLIQSCRSFTNLSFFSTFCRLCEWKTLLRQASGCRPTSSFPSWRAHSAWLSSHIL